jgi:hypothetical protein
MFSTGQFGTVVKQEETEEGMRKKKKTHRGKRGKGKGKKGNQEILGSWMKVEVDDFKESS